ncbi:thioredoxin [Tothia fuscella]|uniref:Thioredoxin n=1 Tax=Tothia fuscella TaxID=1048955 RepID=A0A9P4P2W0_9PEZI|nr:thioredoxin [Tothia fuscella]
MATVKLTEITTEADFAHLKSTIPSSALLVVYFHAPWAEPCKQMSTFLETLASTYPSDRPPKIAFASLDAEELPEISEDYDVTAVPFIVLQKGAERLETISGSDSAKVRTLVEKHAGKGGSSGQAGLPPAQQVIKPVNGPAQDGVKDLSAHKTGPADPSTAPEFSSGEKSKEETFKRLEGLVKAAPVMLFMKGTPSSPQCGFSRQTVALLRERSIRYGFFNILADDEVRQGLKEYSDWPTFPQLYADGDLVGGLDIVREEFQNNPEFLMEYSVKPAASSPNGQTAAQTV